MSNANTSKALVVPRPRVKEVSTIFKAHGLYDSRRKIQPFGSNNPESPDGATFAIPLLMPESEGQDSLPQTITDTLMDLKIPINLIEQQWNKRPSASNRTLHASTQKFLARHPPRDPETLLSTLPKRWSLYPPLILLPHTSFSSPEWKEYLDALPDDLQALFFAQITSTLKATHLAINAPIKSTAIRSPHITPLYGDFGPLVPGTPTQLDFDTAFWATAQQNGIKQTWAPLYTMFSRGNITEKTRVLSFPDIQGEEVADLFVGIGYFAFSYLKAGAKRVWGWDLNPWSIEGLRRGAVMNGWKCIVNPGDAQDTQLVVYNEDNKAAAERLRELDVRVRHVNLGLLPSSHLAWKIAAEILDEKGGWIHVHGNCKDSEIDIWSGDVAQEFRGLFDSTWQVEIKHPFRVKEFGPGVGHWVLDVVCSRS